MKNNTGILPEIDNLLKTYSFDEILDGLCYKAIVKSNECAALGCKADAARLHKLARRIYTARADAFGPEVKPN